MFGARGVSSVTLGSLPPVLLALALGRRASRKSACKDRSSLGSISRFVSACQLDLVYDRDSDVIAPIGDFGHDRPGNPGLGLAIRPCNSAAFVARVLRSVSSCLQL